MLKSEVLVLVCFLQKPSAASSHVSAELFNDYFYSVYLSKSVIPESFNFSTLHLFYHYFMKSQPLEDIFPNFNSLDTSKALDIDNIDPNY